MKADQGHWGLSCPYSGVLSPS